MRKNYNLYFQLILILIIGGNIFGDDFSYKIEGHIYDQETAKELAYVNVFIANSSYGVISDENGYFILNNIPFSTYTMVFQHVGYQIASKIITSKKDKNISMNLIPHSIKMDSVVVQSNKGWLHRKIRKLRREQRLGMFQEKFIGLSGKNVHCEIINPEVLIFYYDEEENIYHARSDTLLIVKNNHLGYEISVGIDDFRWKEEIDDWDVKYRYYLKFQDLKPITSVDKMKWRNNRKNAYYGSWKHFFYLLYRNPGYNDYFQIYLGENKLVIPEDHKYKRGIQVTTKILPIDEKDVYRKLIITKHIDGNRSVYFPFDTDYIIFVDKNQNKSYFDLNREEMFEDLYYDKFGNLLNGHHIIKGGMWGDYGVADLLPKEYMVPRKRKTVKLK